VKPVRVVYIVGTMRSGSTMLGDLLGQVPGYIHIGELVHIWEHGLRHDWLCGCGVKFSQCPLWSRVVPLSFGDPPRVDVQAMIDLGRRWSRIRNLLLLASAGGRERIHRAMAPHTDAMIELYGAIREVSGAEVIVDSSKRPLFAWLAAPRPEVDVRVLHLTRDPRAVAYSRRRLKFNPDKQRNMGGHGPVSTSVAWLSRSSVAAALWERSARETDYILVRYEDFAAAPRRAFERVLEWLGEDQQKAGVIGPEGDYLAVPGHTIAGNPVRFKSGVVKVKLDAEWQRKASPWDNFLVSALTSPLLGRNGYPLRATRSD
jgi:hypothetical protein